MLFIAGGIGLAPVRCVIWNCSTCATSSRMSPLFTAHVRSATWSTSASWKIGASVPTSTWSRGRSGWGNPGMEGPRRAYSYGGRRVRSEGGRHICGDLRPAGHDQVHVAGADEAGLPGRPHLHDSGKPHEVRSRQVRTLQHRPDLCLQGRPRVHCGSDTGIAAGVLNCNRAAWIKHERVSDEQF